MEDNAKEAAQKIEQKIELPRQEAPIMQYDSEKNMFWIGIPVDKVPPFEGVVMLDSMKIEYLKAFGDAVRRENERKSKIVSPAEHTSMMKNFVGKFKK